MIQSHASRRAAGSRARSAPGPCTMRGISTHWAAAPRRGPGSGLRGGGGEGAPAWRGKKARPHAQRGEALLQFVIFPSFAREHHGGPAG